MFSFCLIVENRHRKELKRRFGDKLRGKYVRVLGIPDEHDYRDPILIALLRAKVPPKLGVF